MKVDETMGRYILSILNSNQPVFWSWGPSKLAFIKNGLKFHVQGFKFIGNVEIVYNEPMDLFDIIYTEDETNEVTREDEVFFDSLVEIIDLFVEKTNDYQKRVKDLYHLS